jgi:hypothetical protein
VVQQHAGAERGHTGPDNQGALRGARGVDRNRPVVERGSPAQGRADGDVGFLEGNRTRLTIRDICAQGHEYDGARYVLENARPWAEPRKAWAEYGCVGQQMQVERTGVAHQGAARAARTDGNSNRDDAPE